jgi:DHA2 family multidrug resistance protein-like MFS transporter
MVTGMTMVAGGLGIYQVVSVNSGFGPLSAAFALIGGGMGLVIGPASNAIINTLPEGRIGGGSGLRSTVQLLGGSFGVAVIASLATSRYTAELNRGFRGSLAAVPAGARSSISEQIGTAISTAKTLPTATGDHVVSFARQAFMDGLHLSALVGLIIVGLATVAAAAWIPRTQAELTEDQQAEAGAIV